MEESDPERHMVIGEESQQNEAYSDENPLRLSSPTLNNLVSPTTSKKPSFSLI
jgi:hypothetical protein